MTAKAKESIHVQKARKKIQKQMAEADQRVTSEALHNMSKVIQMHLVRHSRERIALKDRNISLFDENQHSAKTESKYIKHLTEQLKKKYPKGAKPLEGRIKIK